MEVLGSFPITIYQYSTPTPVKVSNKELSMPRPSPAAKALPIGNSCRELPEALEGEWMSAFKSDSKYKVAGAFEYQEIELSDQWQTRRFSRLLDIRA
jgi:hypothetical protein